MDTESGWEPDDEPVRLSNSTEATTCSAWDQHNGEL